MHLPKVILLPFVDSIIGLATARPQRWLIWSKTQGSTVIVGGDKDTDSWPCLFFSHHYCTSHTHFKKKIFMQKCWCINCKDCILIYSWEACENLNQEIGVSNELYWTRFSLETGQQTIRTQHFQKAVSIHVLHSCFKLRKIIQLITIKRIIQVEIWKNNKIKQKLEM